MKKNLSALQNVGLAELSYVTLCVLSQMLA